VFILLLYEVMRMEFFIRDPTSIIQKSLLDQKFTTQSNITLNVALAISSLNVLPIGKTNSGRGIHSIKLPSKLNCSSIGLFRCREVSIENDRGYDS